MFRIRKGLKCSLCAVLSVFILFTAVLRPVVKAEAAAIAGGIALEKILETLIISAGVTYLGVELGSDAVNNIKSDSEAYQSLKTSILSCSAVSGALADALSWSEKFSTEGSSSLDDDYVYESPSGFRVTNGGGNKPGGSIGAAINVGLSAKLIQVARDAAKDWIDNSAANEYEEAYKDESISSSISGLYPKTVNYSTVSLPVFDTIDYIDTYFGSEGISDFIKSKGYDDSNSFALFYSSGGFLYFYIIPFGYSFFVSGSTGFSSSSFFRNEYFRDFLSVAGNKDYSGLRSYISFKGYETAQCYRYSNVEHLVENVSSYFYPSTPYSDYFVFNYDDAIEAGSYIRYLIFSDSVINLTDYTYDSIGRWLVYDFDKAPNYRDVWDPSNGYVEYGIPENMITGGSFASLGEMVEYANSLCAALNEWQESQDKNHDEDMEQGNNILDAINQAVKGISGVSDLIGDVAASILKLPLSIAENIQAKIIEIFPDSVSVGDAIIELPDIVRGLPDVMRDNFKDMLTDFNPAIEIPEINIPEITIPEINIPPIEVPAPDVNVELNPNYEITVNNDYTGLSDIIANAVESVLIKLFIPDEALLLDKVGAVKLYFSFIDDITGYIRFFTDEFEGITPSPYLRIPIGQERSRYDYGLGKEIVIDVSWYSEYKSYGDKIITAICWGFFLWRMFIRLPDIISGSGGSIMASYNSYHNYEKSTKTKGD